jgi:hypothetical protein
MFKHHSKMAICKQVKHSLNVRLKDLDEIKNLGLVCNFSKRNKKPSKSR